MAAAFGLTPAETRVLASLFAGRHTLAETAAALGIAGTTVKTLKRIFPKTGVTRQTSEANPIYS